MGEFVSVPLWAFPLLATILIWSFAAAVGWFSDQGSFDLLPVFAGLCCLILTLITWLIWALFT